MRATASLTLARALRGPTLLALLVAAPSASAQTTWYVDDDASSMGADGQSWATAFATLERAFFQAVEGDRIWVAEGTYRPIVRTDATDPRSVTFLVPQAVKLYGGFDGTEQSLDQRAGLFRQTILTADIGVPGDPSDNAYRAVSIINPSGVPPGGTRVDGFTIRDARGSGQGGGVYSWNSGTTVANCIVANNQAAQGAAFHAQPGALRILGCTVVDNEALDKGGAIWGHVLNLDVVHTTFARNTAAGKGGAVFLHSQSGAESGRFVGCLFHDNVADRGGAVFLGGGQFSAGGGIFQGCTFALNRAHTKGGAVNAVTGTTIPADGRLYDCIVWRNVAPEDPQLGGDLTVAYCDVQDGAAGPGNISLDPRFQDLAGRNFRLRAGSPCIDAGDNALVPNDQFDVDDDGDHAEPLPLDLAGRPRLVDIPSVPDTGSGSPPLVDIGAYERQQ